MYKLFGNPMLHLGAIQSNNGIHSLQTKNTLSNPFQFLWAFGPKPVQRSGSPSYNAWWVSAFCLTVHADFVQEQKSASILYSEGTAKC